MANNTPIGSEVRVGPGTRIIAKMIDLLLVFILAAVIFYPFGPILGFIYSILADGIQYGSFRGQSLGKKLLKLRVVHNTTRKPATLRESMMRNSPVGVATFLAIIPVWGWLFLVLIGFPMMIMEVYLMVTAKEGHRLGDVMGDTEVVSALK